MPPLFAPLCCPVSPLSLDKSRATHGHQGCPPHLLCPRFAGPGQWQDLSYSLTSPTPGFPSRLTVNLSFVHRSVESQCLGTYLTRPSICFAISLPQTRPPSLSFFLRFQDVGGECSPRGHWVSLDTRELGSTAGCPSQTEWHVCGRPLNKTQGGPFPDILWHLLTGTC